MATIDDEFLPILANVLDAIDPELSPDERIAAAGRARDEDPAAGFAFTLGLLTGFVQEIYKIDPTVMVKLRTRAGSA
jgi:hypothetical protein